MLYASECWTVNKADVLWIDSLHQWCLRRILGLKWSDFVRNEDVRHATQQPPLSSIVKTRRLSLFGHIARMNELTDASRILFEPPSEIWRKPRGRPRNSWVQTVTNDLANSYTGQERQLRTGSTGGCLRSIAQRPRSGACSYWNRKVVFLLPEWKSFPRLCKQMMNDEIFRALLLVGLACLVSLECMQRTNNVNTKLMINQAYSGGLPIMQSRQQPKARYGAEAHNII